VANSEEEEEEEETPQWWWLYVTQKKTKYKRCDVFFYFRSSITIKLKCFSNIIVMGSFNRISDKLWLVLLVESMLANFAALLVSFGLRILSVLLFADFSSFTGVVLAVSLLIPSLLIFALLFVIVSSRLCARLTAILISRTTTLSEFVLVGFVFLLSALFFWSFKSSTHTPVWSAAHQLPMIPCVRMGLCLTPRIPYSTVKSLDFTSSIPAVGCVSFLRFRVLVLYHLGAVVSTVVLDLPTKPTSICFPSATVSVRRMFVCVLRVLMKSLMTKGVPPPCDGIVCNLRRLYILFTLRRSNLTAGALGSTFFFSLNPDVREIVLSSQ
jgi:hypothetical protein